MPNRLPQNLHSTMLLLYLMIGVDNTTIDSIYIPLCFYFIRTIHCTKAARVMIYIPLCFYFIQEDSYSQKHLNGIYIPLCFYFIANPEADEEWPARSFTFHYASTLSRIGGVLSTMQQNLHSTMLLLYLYAEKCREVAELIYIPLCFYFIRIPWEAPGRMGPYLHSTMLLLYLHLPSFPCHIA